MSYISDPLANVIIEYIRPDKWESWIPDQDQIYCIYKVSIVDGCRVNETPYTEICKYGYNHCCRIYFEPYEDIDNYTHFYFVVLKKEKNIETKDLYFKTILYAARYYCFKTGLIENKYLNVERKLLFYFLFSIFTFDELIYVKKEEDMLKIKANQRKNYPFNKNEPLEPKIYELLGYYVPSTRQIFLCDELIEKAYKYLKLSDEMGIEDFRTMILFHEIGHCVFDTGKYKYANVVYSEKLANFFSSLFTLGIYDHAILKLISRQNSWYQKPLMYSERLNYNINQLIEDFLNF